MDHASEREIYNRKSATQMTFSCFPFLQKNNYGSSHILIVISTFIVYKICFLHYGNTQMLTLQESLAF